MAKKMDEFLLRFFEQYRFNSMPAEVRARFDDYDKAKDFMGHMKMWSTDLKDKKYDRFGGGSDDLPDNRVGDWKLEDDEIDKLYKAFQVAFVGMSAARDADPAEFDKEAGKFLDEYFGMGRLFGDSQITPDAQKGVDDLLAIYEDDHDKVAKETRRALERMVGQILGSDMTVDKFFDGLKKQKYNKDAKFQQLVNKVARQIAYNFQYDKILANATPKSGNWDAIEKLGRDDAFGVSQTTIDANRDEFRDELGVMLRRLSDSKKIYDVFKSYDDGKISKQLEKAKGNVAYDDKNSKDFIHGKNQEELNMRQRMGDMAKGKWRDLMGKYNKIGGSRVYFSDQAGMIIDALDKANLKKTEGLKGFINKADDIKKKLIKKSPSAPAHLDWMVEKLKQIESDTPGNFSKAMRNGRHMRAVAAQLISKGLAEGGKKAELKTALEVLGVLHYGYTTSKIMEVLSSDKNFSLLSDSGLSWNKNEGIAFVMRATDRTIRAAFLGIGYGITVAGNLVNRHYKKRSSKKGMSKNLDAEHRAWSAKNEIYKQDAVKHKDRLERNRDAMQANLDAMAADGYDDASIDVRRAERDAAKTDYENKRTEFERSSSVYNRASEELRQRTQNRADADNVRKNTSDRIKGIRTAEAEKANLENQLNDPNTYAGLPAPAANVLAAKLAEQIKQQQQIIDEHKSELSRLRAQHSDLAVKGITDKDIQDATDEEAVALADKDAKERDANVAATEYNTRNDKVSKFESATEDLKTLNDAYSKAEKTVNDWDKDHPDDFAYFMGYWDYLQSGGTKRNNPLRGHKAQQKSFNAKKDAVLDTWIADRVSHGYYAA